MCAPLVPSAATLCCIDAARQTVGRRACEMPTILMPVSQHESVPPLIFPEMASVRRRVFVAMSIAFARGPETHRDGHRPSGEMGEIANPRKCQGTLSVVIAQTLRWPRPRRSGTAVMTFPVPTPV